ncbi:MAG: HD domain-containing protein [Candidatus Methanofastidiosia archaeon]|jgi:HD superfamily phosphohydrolase
MELDLPHISNNFLIRDPIHDYIVFDKVKFEFLLKILNSFEFQRLRRIKQMGTTYFVYPGADHSRFGHSIGTMWLAFKFGNKFTKDGLEISNDLMSKIVLTALIHDIGHGPFSHVFEKITRYNHEEMTLKFIEERLPEIITSFSSNEIKKILKKELEPNNAWIGDLLDSQIDIDRMDFLLRDSLYTGVNYGLFDIQRVFYSLTVGDIQDENHLMMRLKGLHAFEEFFIAYHHMYWQVYFHKTTRACEVLIEKIFLRMEEIIEDIHIDISPQLEKLLTKKQLDLNEFFILDDCTILETIKKCRNSKDIILSDLCNRFFDRKLFKLIKKDTEISFKTFEKIQGFYERKNISYKYYFANDDPEKISVERPVLEKGLLMGDIDKSGNVVGPVDFLVKSKIIFPLYNTKYKEFRMYCPANLVKDLRNLLKNI